MDKLCLMFEEHFYVTAQKGAHVKQAIEDTIKLCNEFNNGALLEFNQVELMIQPDSDYDKVYKEYFDSLQYQGENRE